MPWTAPTKYFPRVYHGSTVRDDIRYHYTKGVHLPKIAQDGALDPAYEGLPDDRPRVLWASTHPVWEATVNIGIGLPDRHGLLPTATFEGTVAAVHGVYRFALAPESVPYDFAALMDLTGASPRERHRFAATGRDKGAHPSDWWGTLSLVSQAEWLDVQRWDPDRCDWVSIDLEREVERLRTAGLPLGLPSRELQQELTAHYLGQHVIVGQTFDALESAAHEARYYILGTFDPQSPALPDHVWAIIEDDQQEAVDEFLMLWDVQQHEGEVRVTSHPLIVIDQHERCLYGRELLAAIAETGQTMNAVVLRVTRLEEPDSH